MNSFRQIVSIISKDLPKKSLFVFLVRYFIDPEFRLLLNYRLGRYFTHSKNPFYEKLANRFRYVLVTKRNCDISYQSKIGNNISFPHPIGIVIGIGVVVGDHVKIWQNVTIGSHGKNSEKVAYPVIGNNVKIFAGAKIFGGITIGENAIIGANSVVNIDVPKNAIAVGVPCKIIPQNE